MTNAPRSVTGPTFTGKLIGCVQHDCEHCKARDADLENERRKVTELVDGYEKDQAELKRLRTTIFTDNTQTVVNAEKRIAELEAGIDNWKTKYSGAMDVNTDLRAEVERLSKALVKANAQTEEFERKYYLAEQESESMLEELKRFK